MNQFNTFVRLWAVAGGAIMLLIVAVTAVNVGAFALDVALRSFGWRIPALPGYEDFVRLAIGPALLMLFPYCQLQRGHIAADFLPPDYHPRCGAVWIYFGLGLRRRWPFF